MALYRKTILLLTFTLFMSLGWSATCQDGSDCQACCYKEAVNDQDATLEACCAPDDNGECTIPSVEGCAVYYWEDRCEQMSDNGLACGMKHKHSLSSGCPCNGDGVGNLNLLAFNVDGTIDWYSQGTNSQNGCGCQTGGNNPENYDRSCCAVGTGYHLGAQDDEYSCGGGGGGDGVWGV